MIPCGELMIVGTRPHAEIIITHIPTQITVKCGIHDNAFKDRQEAMKMLELKLEKHHATSLATSMD